MTLRIKTNQARVLESIDITVGAITLSLVEGPQLEDPLKIVLKKPDHFEGVEALTLDELLQLADAVRSYIVRLQTARLPDEPEEEAPDS